MAVEKKTLGLEKDGKINFLDMSYDLINSEINCRRSLSEINPSGSFGVIQEIYVLLPA